MDVVLPLLLVPAALLALAGGSRWLRRRREAALASGTGAVFRVRLAGASAPYPQRPRRGTLTVGNGTLLWRGRGGAAHLDLSATGVRALGPRDAQRGDNLGHNEVVLGAEDGRGTALRFVGLHGTVEHLEDVLRRRSTPEEPQPAQVVVAARLRPALLLPASLVLLGVLGAGATGWVAGTAERVSATVLTEPDVDGYCDVRWTDPRDGSSRVNGIECYDDVGDEVPMLALADPLRGEVVSADDLPFLGGLALAATGAGVGLYLWRRRQLRRDQQAPPAPATAPTRRAPLTAEQLTHDGIRVALQQWAAARTGAAGDGLGPGRSLVLALALACWPLVPAVTFALLVGWTSLAGLWASAGSTVRTTATVTDSYLPGAVPLVPGDLEVTFRLRGGGTETTLVAVRGLPEPAPRTLAVEYSLQDPDRARALAHDGAAVGGAAAGGLLLAGLGASGWNVWPVLRWRRARRRALASSGRQVPYLLAPDDDDGTSMLLLWPGSTAAPPRYVLELDDDLRGAVSASGTVEVRGCFEAGAVVAALVLGRPLGVASPLLEIEEADLLELLNGGAAPGAEATRPAA